MQVTEHQLANIVREVLDTMAFALIARELAEDFPSGQVLRAEVAFRGPLDGVFALAMPVLTLDELAGNMLAVADGEPCSPQQQQDALGEMANVICGNVLALAAGPDAVFDLAPPSVVEGPEPALEGGGDSGKVSACVPLENGWALATLAFAVA